MNQLYVVWLGAGATKHFFDPVKAATCENEYRGKYDTIKTTVHKIDVPVVTEYTAAINAEIQEYIADRLADVISSRGWLSCSWSDAIVQRKGYSYAVFGSCAYQLLHGQASTISAPLVLLDDESEFHYVPVMVSGKMFRIDPEEGRGGLLYLMRCVKRRGVVKNGDWMCTDMSTGWLRMEELGLSNQEIMDNIADEIDAGATHLTGGVPGWA
jgi:hypothetical protein